MKRAGVQASSRKCNRLSLANNNDLKMQSWYPEDGYILTGFGTRLPLNEHWHTKHDHAQAKRSGQPYFSISRQTSHVVRMWNKANAKVHQASSSAHSVLEIAFARSHLGKTDKLTACPGGNGNFLSGKVALPSRHLIIDEVNFWCHQTGPDRFKIDERRSNHKRPYRKHMREIEEELLMSMDKSVARR